MHIPVMLEETINALNIKNDGKYLDLTTGFGGHSSKIIEKMNNGILVCVDRDNEALEYSEKRLEEIKKGNSISFFKSNYSHLDAILEKYGKFDGIIADLGVSSYQLDQKNRGFSYRYEYDLDMRMDKKSSKKAIDLFELGEDKIADVLYYFGEITSSRRLAFNLKEAFLQGKLLTTFDLKNVIDSTFNSSSPKIYSQVFQAIRIWTNDELASLEKMLDFLPNILNASGRIVILTYHSLEDRLVKKYFSNGISRTLENGYKDYDFEAYFKKVGKGFVKPSKEEIFLNKRARSAKMRVVERI